MFILTQVNEREDANVYQKGERERRVLCYNIFVFTHFTVNREISTHERRAANTVRELSWNSDLMNDRKRQGKKKN